MYDNSSHHRFFPLVSVSATWKSVSIRLIPMERVQIMAYTDSNNYTTILFSCIILSVLLIQGCAEKPAPSPVSNATRETNTGPVVGTEGKYGGFQWLGIPYARPPIDDRRWKAPEPPSDRGETLTAVTHGSPCSQLASPLGGVTTVEKGTPAGSEDCLYLDVYSPDFAPDEVPKGKDGLPVMVWIHGGGNVIGHTELYDASKLASEQNVIVVAVQYRLGPLGWFRHPALRTGNSSPAEHSGNFALLDLVRSLKWVEKNISSFGGNPDNVTVFGESAGGRNIYSLMLYPGAKGLFDRAIVQSGALDLSDPDRAEKLKSNGGDRDSSREVLLRLLRKEEGLSRKQARARMEAMSETETLTYLKNQKPGRLLEVYEPSPLGLPINPPRLFADGTVLPTDDPLEVFSDPSRYNNVPIITGTNRDETKLFLSQDPRWRSRFLWLVPQPREPELYHLVAEYTSRLWKAHAVDQVAPVLRDSQGPNVYAYRFDWDDLPTILGTDLSKLLGAAHGMEIPFVFGDFDFGPERTQYFFTEENREPRLKLSRTIRTYWTKFARTGNPNPGESDSLTDWKPWNSSSDTSPRYLIFDKEADGGLRTGSRTYSLENLIDNVSSDPRLDTRRKQCVIYRAMATTVGDFHRSDYEKIGACSDFGWEGYPWRGR